MQQKVEVRVLAALTHSWTGAAAEAAAAIMNRALSVCLSMDGWDVDARIIGSLLCRLYLSKERRNGRGQRGRESARCFGKICPTESSSVSLPFLFQSFCSSLLPAGCGMSECEGRAFATRIFVHEIFCLNVETAQRVQIIVPNKSVPSEISEQRSLSPLNL